MSNPLLLKAPEPEYVDERDALIEGLEEEIRTLKQELQLSRGEVAQLKRTNAKAVGALRQQLSPLYRALQAVFGEMEAIGTDGSEVSSSNPRWESWKQRMPGRPAEFIDLLLIHGSMTVKQFMAAAHCGQNTVYQIVSKMGQAGILQNTGGKYSLREA